MAGGGERGCMRLRAPEDFPLPGGGSRAESGTRSSAQPPEAPLWFRYLLCLHFCSFPQGSLSVCILCMCISKVCAHGKCVKNSPLVILEGCIISQINTILLKPGGIRRMQGLRGVGGDTHRGMGSAGRAPRRVCLGGQGEDRWARQASSPGVGVGGMGLGEVPQWAGWVLMPWAGPCLRKGRRMKTAPDSWLPGLSPSSAGHQTDLRHLHQPCHLAQPLELPRRRRTETLVDGASGQGHAQGPSRCPSRLWAPVDMAWCC